LNKFHGSIRPTARPLQTPTPTVCFMVYAYACAYTVLPRPQTDLTAGDGYNHVRNGGYDLWLSRIRNCVGYQYWRGALTRQRNGKYSWSIHCRCGRDSSI